MPRPDGPPRLQSLTSLRFPAALAVLVAHVGGMSASAGTRSALHQGSVGVSFFFVLSGFLLVWARSAAVGPVTFYRRRLARVYPLHAVTWVVAVGLAAAGVLQGYSRRGDAAALLLVQAWSPDPGIVFAGNTVSWSLSCELVFYAVLPLVVLVLDRLGGRGQWALVVACAVLTVLVVPLVAPGEAWSYTFPPARLVEFVAGAGLAARVRAGWRCPVPLGVAVVLLAVAVAASTVVPATFRAASLTAVPVALVVVAAATRELGGAVGVLGHPWLTALGRWSFAFYLVHNLVVGVVLHVTGYLSVAGLLVAGPSVALLSLALSALAHRLVEAPAERRLRGPGRRPVSLDT